MINNFLFSLAFLALFLTPDLFLNLFFNYYTFSSKNTLKEIVITFFIGFLISFLDKKKKLFFLILFTLLIIGEIGYFLYFRSYILPYQLLLVFDEAKDIIDSFLALKKEILMLTLFFVSYILIFLKLIKLKTKTNNRVIFLIIAIFIGLYFAIKNKKELYIPNPSHFSYLNTLFAINIALIPNNNKNTNFKDYIIKKLPSSKENIIVVIGESLNYKRMNLFGWDINNTPLLNSLKNDIHFIYKKAISSGINTPVSIVSFFLLKREPKNTNLLLTQKTNLLKLAKENGYKTYWLSMQEEGTKIFTILNYADIKKTRKDFKTKFDETLLKELKTIDFTKKNFIILHLRANHSPYEKYTPKKFYKFNFKSDNYHIYKTNSYYNSILYVDYLLYNLINFIKDKNVSLYFIPDHGEMLGFKDENFKYGHSQLTINDAFIPFIYYGNKKFPKKIYNHYLIAKEIAKDIGYEIINPNEDGNFYINGVKIDGSAGFIKYNLQKIDY